MGNDTSRPPGRRLTHQTSQNALPQVSSQPITATGAPKPTPTERLANVEQLIYSEFEIPEVGGLLGYGASARVYKGLWKKTPVAIKRFFELISADDFINEVLMTSSLRHQNIAPFIGYTMEPMCIVTQYYSKGSLFDVLHVKQPQLPLSKHLKIKIAKDIARGMIYLHSKGLVHRDLKPGNLLINSLSIDDVVSCVITDFGITREQSPLMTAGQGTPVYSAPEVFSGKKDLHYSRKVDVFSFGIILWEIWMRKIPFQELTEPVVDVIGRGERPPIGSQEDFPSDYLNLMRTCWSQNPEHRPLFEEVLQKLEEEIEPKLGPFIEEPSSGHRSLSGSNSGGGSGSVSAPSTGTGWIDTRYQDFHRRSNIISSSSISSSSSSSLSSSSTLSPSSSSSGLSLLGTNSGSELVTGGMSSLSIYPVESLSIAPRSKTDLAVDDAKIIPGDRLEWEVFVNALQYKFNAPENAIATLKPYVEEAGFAVKKKFIELLKWFSPLMAERAAVYQTAYQAIDIGLYQEAAIPTTNDTELPTVEEADSGYTISEIATLLSEEWFHGFISSGECTAKLAKEPIGTFLLRFSGSKPGAYALSLQNGNREPKTVVHWLITPEPKKKFKVFHHIYANLHEIVEIHQKDPLKLQDGKNASLFIHPLSKH